MGLRDIGESLPPGFRFYPSDEELVCHYLYKKITNEEALMGTLVEINLHTCEPWQLPEVAKLNGKEWYFFSLRDRKYGRGERANRATTEGYWKATGKDRMVLNPKNGEVMGMRKTLVFYRKRAPNGIKTGWIMHEFRIQNPNFPPKEDWVLCRVFHKSKRDEINTKITQINREFVTVPPDSTSLSSLCSPSSYVQFPPAAETNRQQWNNMDNHNIVVEEVAGRFRSTEIDDDYSTIQQIKLENIEDSFLNEFFSFEYFIA